MLNYLSQGSEVSCSFFQWYDPDLKLRKPNESEVSSSDRSRRVSRSSLEDVTKANNKMNEESNRVQNHARDGEIVWKCMVFFLLGVLLGIWVK